MAATNESAADGLDFASAGQGPLDWTLDESRLDFDLDNVLYTAAAAETLFPETLPGESLWPLAPAGASPETPDSPWPSGLGDTFSAANMSPGSPATEYSLNTQQPSPQEALLSGIASPEDRTGSASLFGPLGLRFHESAPYPQLFGGMSPLISLSQPSYLGDEAQQLMVPPIDDYLVGANLQTSHVPAQSLSLDPTFPLGGALGGIPSAIPATNGLYPYGSPLMVSPIPGVFPADHSDPRVCTCPHTHAAPVNPAANTRSPGIPIPPSPFRGSHFNDAGSSSGRPLKISARERRKLERPEKCPVPGCAKGVQYVRDVKEHIRAKHKDVAHRFGVSTAKHPCAHPGCAQLFARRDHMKRHWRNKHAGRAADACFSRRDPQAARGIYAGDTAVS